MATTFIYNLTDTWNAGGTTFDGIKLNVTDTGSATDSKLLNLQVDGNGRFTVDKNGNVVVEGSLDLANAVNNQTASYSPVLADAGRYVHVTNAVGVTITVPADASVAYAIGTTIRFEQSGAGALTFAPAAGVTLNSLGGLLSSGGQHGVVTLTKTAANTFTVSGDLA